MILIKKTNKDMNNQFKSMLNIAQRIIQKPDIPGDCHPIYRYINAIGSSVLQRLLMQLFTGQEVADVDELYIDLGRDIKSKIMNASTKVLL